MPLDNAVTIGQTVMPATGRATGQSMLAATMGDRKAGNGQKTNVKTYVFAPQIPTPLGKLATNVTLTHR
ncbi:hypothetical protein WS67_09300 [Burkholderia singularis]|uniref:Uncharacterized protein n=1 Tax=Burkholderia singularis TaxID=1503053 RepID=A0A103E5X0_9BURK|nr:MULTISPECIES: hypothetical protein [Burkholderia]AOK31284.1 hypothetical protein AQ611_16910 [Burkholderia sp. Bp7605]KVE28878.1 hypothetical protein WS67_09300 [Burkholderia singularis]SMF99282.1 hypothetical protein BSIN_0011 [Burkholderia singularis]